VTNQLPGGPDTSNLPTTADVSGGRPRAFTEPLREVCALALLGANATFLFLGASGLLLVIDGWVSDFGRRSAGTFDSFVGGVVPVAFPLLAVLLATHVLPVVGRARLITLAALVEYGVSTFFGAVTFLGAFVYDLSSVRATLEGVVWRLMWAGLLSLAGTVTLRLWLGVFYTRKLRPVRYSAQSPTYGQPYPGQPMYPNTSYTPGQAQPGYPTQSEPTSGASGWPVVPPPPMPTPPVVESEPTQRIPLPPTAEPPTTPFER
jgi:hypothetical protein